MHIEEKDDQQAFPTGQSNDPNNNDYKFLDTVKEEFRVASSKDLQASSNNETKSILEENNIFMEISASPNLVTEREDKRYKRSRRRQSKGTKVNQNNSLLNMLQSDNFITKGSMIGKLIGKVKNYVSDKQDIDSSVVISNGHVQEIELDKSQKCHNYSEDIKTTSASLKSSLSENNSGNSISSLTFVEESNSINAKKDDHANLQSTPSIYLSPSNEMQLGKTDPKKAFIFLKDRKETSMTLCKNNTDLSNYFNIIRITENSNSSDRLILALKVNSCEEKTMENMLIRVFEKKGKPVSSVFVNPIFLNIRQENVINYLRLLELSVPKVITSFYFYEPFRLKEGLSAKKIFLDRSIIPINNASNTIYNICSTVKKEDNNHRMKDNDTLFDNYNNFLGLTDPISRCIDDFVLTIIKESYLELLNIKGNSDLKIPNNLEQILKCYLFNNSNYKLETSKGSHIVTASNETDSKKRLKRMSSEEKSRNTVLQNDVTDFKTGNEARTIRQDISTKDEEVAINATASEKENDYFDQFEGQAHNRKDKQDIVKIANVLLQKVDNVKTETYIMSYLNDEMNFSEDEISTEELSADDINKLKIRVLQDQDTIENLRIDSEVTFNDDSDSTLSTNEIAEDALSSRTALMSHETSSGVLDDISLTDATNDSSKFFKRNSLENKAVTRLDDETPTSSENWIEAPHSQKNSASDALNVKSFQKEKTNKEKLIRSLVGKIALRKKFLQEGKLQEIGMTNANSVDDDSSDISTEISSSRRAHDSGIYECEDENENDMKASNDRKAQLMAALLKKLKSSHEDLSEISVKSMVKETKEQPVATSEKVLHDFFDIFVDFLKNETYFEARFSNL